MVIDSHTHNYEDNGKNYSAKELLASMDKAGIDYSLLLADGAVGGTTTEQVIKTCEKNSRLKAIGCVHFAKIDQNQTDTLVHYLEQKKIYGIKFYPGYEDFYPLDKKLFPLYEHCQRLRKPVIFHTGLLMEGIPGRLKQSHPLNIDDLANSFPDLKIIMAHFGNPWIVDTAAVLVRNKNVYVDVSGYFASYQPILQEHVDFFINDLKYLSGFAESYKRFLFGTDWPLYSQKEYLDVVRKLPLTAEEKELFFWKNAKELFDLDV